ncbi:MAG TPA: tetratricopeptide repeat protein [Flavobacterium sp.]|jgi:signal transduction histidine kinase/tetratricopeptide (TPR) repeat protein
MMRIFALAGIFLFVNSCNTNEKPLRDPESDKYARIAQQYRQIEPLLHKPLDSLRLHLDKMDAALGDAPNEYKAMAQIGAGIYNLNKSAHVLAQKKYETALNLLKNSDADTLRARAFSGLGSVYKNAGDHPKAFDYLYKAQRIYEKHHHKQGIAIINGNIAQIYLQKNDLKLAKEHLEIALKTMAHDKSHYSYMNSLHTLANIYGMSGEYDTALEIDDTAIRIADSIKSPKLKTPFLDNKANCYLYSNRLDSARSYFNACLKIDLQTGNPKQIGDTYCNLGTLALFSKDYAEAERNVKKSIGILTEVDHKPNLLKSYEVLSDIYRHSGRLGEALAAKDSYLDIYRKMMNEKKEAALAEYKIVHETEQKEKIITQNKIDLLVKDREVRQRNYLLFGISLLAIFIALIGWMIYRQQKLKNHQQQQEHDLKSAISQIETQNKLQEQRLSISRDLHDNIGAQLTFIISSVDNLRYAFDLKDTKLESRLQNINNFTRSTIVELRDTIWAMNNSEISFEDLRIRIFNFIEKAKDAAEKISFSFDIDPQLSQIRLSSVSGMNIYRTIQEAVNNAIKYSEAENITVAIGKFDDQAIITISDNGKGFDPAATARGNGLVNMKKRVEDIGGDFLLESGLGHGTTVTISIQAAALALKAVS